MLIALLMMAAAPTAAPTAESVRLGREIAATGTLGSMLPLMKEQQIGDMLAAHPELSPADQARLKAIAERQFSAGQEKVLNAEGRNFADSLSIDDLRAVAAYQRSAAATRMRAALPKIIAGTMQSMQGLDVKGDVGKAMCAETKKMCEPAK